MRTKWSAVALAFPLLVAPAAAGGADASRPSGAAGNALVVDEGGAEPVMAGQHPSAPPPGSKQDQDLWRSGLEVTKRVQIERARANRMQAALVTRRYTDRLRLLTGRGGDAEERGRASTSRIDRAHLSQANILNARWPVDTYRVCGYPAMEFGTMMGDPKTPPDLMNRHRTALVGCVDLAQSSVKLLKEANDELEAALKEADGVLAAAGLGSPTAGLPPKGARDAKVKAADAKAQKAPAGEERKHHEESREHHDER